MLHLSPSRTSFSGSALLIVLAMLMLISALVLAFFSAATSERAADRSFSNSGAVRNLSDTALHLTMAQIADATAGGEPDSSTKKPDPTKPLAWASQPGMIRTFNSGGPYRNYKLYSAVEMTATNMATFSFADDAPPATWRLTPGDWTDLNEPIVAASGTLAYPILDPAALTLSGTGVQGFSITNAPGYSASATASGTNNPAPMPVRWLYQLKDGTLIAATVSGTLSSVPGASATNPIVGRIAFWTDDETCKVNINTAAEGTYWDTPRFAATSPAWAAIMSGYNILSSEVAKYPDYQFALYQPAQYEFQRYPGHPAQVALSTIFPMLTGSTAAGLIPRLVWGGSKGGTLWSGTNAIIDLSTAPRKAPYASIDEFQFSGASTTPRVTNNVGSALTKADLEAAKFFITANSRAPEVNLFNQPRIACWPVDKELATNSSSSRTTAYDRLIAFCSTTRNDLGAAAYRYYFQRSDSQSPTADYTAIQRNQDLYAYLQRLTSSAVPGFGGHFLAKYGADRDQILTEIFDYIRCTNLTDPQLAGFPITTNATAGGVWPKTTKQFSLATKTAYDNTSTHLVGLGQVMPIRLPNGTVGFGRFAAIKELALVFVCVGDGSVPASNVPASNPALSGKALAADEIRVQMMVLFRLNSPAAGMSQFNPDLLVEITGLPNISIANAANISGGGSLFTLPANCSGWFYKTKEAWSRVYSNPLYFDSLLGQGGSGFRPPVFSTSLTSNFPYYPFVSQAFTIKRITPINFSGANLTFRLYEGKNVYDPLNNQLSSTFKDAGAPPLNAVMGNSECLHQTATFTFPADPAIPVPALDTGTNTGTGGFMYKIETRLRPSNAGGQVTSAKDTVRSQCFNGDGRLAALMTNIPASAFITYSGSLTSQTQIQNNGVSYNIGGTGSQTFESSMVPPGTAATSGDFDIACRIGPGGFINKPDEGDGTLMNGYPPYYFYDQNSANTNLYTPNRIMPSPGMFGSLPTGAKAGKSWQTLLFRPQPSHPSYSTTIPDHLMMDLFWMPVVEPYAISEPFSTAGKVNMNYQIMPFTYINRSTGLLSAMKIEMQAAVPNGTTDKYQADPSFGPNAYRKTLNLSATNGSLRQFEEKFNSGKIFRSASEICDIYLVPWDLGWNTDSDATTFWGKNLNTPENLREKPYTNLYARLTTKSNTYTVHIRAQVLQKVPSTPAGQWVEGRDRVVAEDRSSTLIERYVDTEDTSLPDFATNSSSPLLSDHYRMRVLSTKRFTP